MEKFRIPWGRPALGRDLTQDEIEKLKERLKELSDEKNVISARFLPAELKWIEENVENCHVIRVTEDIDDFNTNGMIWAIIGIDEKTAENYCSHI
jgi:hypothetical protein